MLLLLVGLLIGISLESFPSRELASDAHVSGVQHGMLLMIIAALWGKAALGRAAVACGWLTVIGLYGIWFAFLLGALIGEQYPSETRLTFVIFVVNSWILIAGVVLLLFGMIRFRNTSA